MALSVLIVLTVMSVLLCLVFLKGRFKWLYSAVNQCVFSVLFLFCPVLFCICLSCTV